MSAVLLASLQTDLGGIRGQLHECQDELRQTRDECERVKKDGARKTKRVTELEARISSVENELRSARDALNNREKIITEKEKQLSEQKVFLSDREKQLEDLQEVISKQKEKIYDQHDETAKYIQKCHNLEASIEQINRNYESSSSETHKELEKRKEVHTNETHRYEELLSACQQAKDFWQSQWEAKAKQYEDLQKSFEQVQNEWKKEWENKQIYVQQNLKEEVAYIRSSYEKELLFVKKELENKFEEQQLQINTAEGLLALRTQQLENGQKKFDKGKRDLEQQLQDEKEKMAKEYQRLKIKLERDYDEKAMDFIRKEKDWNYEKAKMDLERVRWKHGQILKCAQESEAAVVLNTPRSVAMTETPRGYHSSVAGMTPTAVGDNSLRTPRGYPTSSAAEATPGISPTVPKVFLPPTGGLTAPPGVGFDNTTSRYPGFTSIKGEGFVPIREETEIPDNILLKK